MVEAGQVSRSPWVQSGESSWSDLHQFLQSRNPGVQDPAALELGRTHCHLHPSKRKGTHGWVFLCSGPDVRLLPLNPYLHSAASPSFSSFTIAEAEAWKTRVIYKGQSWSWTQGNAAWNPDLFFHTSLPLRSVATRTWQRRKRSNFCEWSPRVGHRYLTSLSLIILTVLLLLTLFYRWRQTGSESLCSLPKVVQPGSGRAEVNE